MTSAVPVRVEETTRITVALALGDLLVARLRAAIEADSRFCLVARDVAYAQLDVLLADRAPQVVVIGFADSSLPLNMRQLRARHQHTQIVALIGPTAEVDPTALMALGAGACLTTDMSAGQILATLPLVVGGLKVLPANVMLPSWRPTKSYARLTAREHDVLGLICNGRTNAEIADELHIGIETVKTHVKHILRKRNVRSRHELIPVAEAGVTRLDAVVASQERRRDRARAGQCARWAMPVVSAARRVRFVEP